MEIQSKRILKILKLFDIEKKVLNSASMAVLIGVSSRTIRNDIKECNAMIQKHGAQIQAETGVGYMLKIYDENRYDAFKDAQSNEGRKGWLKNHIIPSDHNDRISFIIAELLLNSLHERVVTESELADELFISLSTLKKYMKDIKKSLRRFGVEIIADRMNGVRIKGDEAQIRYCISEYIFNSNDLVDLAQNVFYRKLFSLEEIEKVKQIILKVILKYNIHLTDIAFKNLLVHIIITLKRADRKNTTEYSKEQMMILEESIDFSVVSPLYEITEETIKSVDFIFTTVPIQGIHSEKIIQVEPILTEEDLGKIEMIIHGDEAESQEHFFREDLFFPGLKANSKMDVLEKMTDLMLKKGYIDQAGKKSVFAREQMASTELGSLIAIPHALENHSKEAAIAVAVLEKPILWDKEKVQVVFLLSIPKSKCRVWEPVFERLYRYFISDFGVNTLIKNAKFKVLIEKLGE
ncbi:PTS sugar transporter subunit IIA [Pelosinus fermentans]|uniref:BglG family transcription antiterminator n=1 Tax=Pelosinus fermentans TaxID=365349 RepID=UPI0002DDEC24